jgi:alkylation response protein AidB-like acyl-CoA dehydrogenase
MVSVESRSADTAAVREPLDGQAILANARSVAHVLVEEAPESERLRRLTPRAVDALRSTGVFRMPMPAAWGGPEVDIRTQVEILEELAAADGSAGWCAMIGSDGGFYSAALDDAAARELYPDLDAVTAGWIVPAGKLHRVDGGYLLEGRWQFGSGCTHADVIVGGALVYEDGSPAISDDGKPEFRIAMLPAERFEILDTWRTTGLAGTGSHDYRIDGAFVPAGHTFRFRDLRNRRRDGVLYAWPGMFVANFSGVALGIARAALQDTDHVLEDKILMPERRPARHEPRVRAAVASAHAMIGAARSYVFAVLDELWATLEAGDRPSLRLRASLFGMHGHTLRACREAVGLLAEAVGSTAINRGCGLERRLRDLTTIGAHVVTQPRTSEAVGALWLGVEDLISENPLHAEGLL